MAEQKPFEIGLVMAGAVSAGAYTAGVLDFLLQALDTWQQAKDAGAPDAPPHSVKIKVMSGASAGGMTAALAATIINRELVPVTRVPPPGSVYNKLYESWVERVDISRLLEGRDLEAPDSHVTSLLDATVLDEIAEFAFREDGTSKVRPYFDDHVHVLMSVTNLRGVPYSIGFVGDQSKAHELSMHADHMHFVVGTDEPEGDAMRLDPGNLDSPGWQDLKQAALATGAFPVGLPPRQLRRRVGDYAVRKWEVPLPPGVEVEGQRCRQEVEIPPHWPANVFTTADEGYTFLCVDGGLMNNEPLELARRILAGSDQRNPREGNKARRAVLMIDPFPDVAPFDPRYRPNDKVLSVVSEMFASLRYQACFKPDELALAYARDVYSRFLIAPSRPTEPNQHPLACGSLGAFGGFLSKRFRQHDFVLGRRNCQRFLQKYFCLPEDNPLFAGWTDEMRTRYRSEEGELPIIPLVGELNDVRIERLPWPSMSDAELSTLAYQIGQRAGHLLRGLLPKNLWISTQEPVDLDARATGVAPGGAIQGSRADYERNQEGSAAEPAVVSSARGLCGGAGLSLLCVR
jgi:hypothetical protein